MDDDSLRPAVFAFLVGGAVVFVAILVFVVLVPNDREATHRSRARADETRTASSPVRTSGTPLAGYQPPCTEWNSCRDPADDALQAYADSRACDLPGKRVCLLPIGGVPKDLVDHLVGYYRERYQLELHVMQPTGLGLSFSEGHPGQLSTQGIRELMHRMYPELSKDQEVVFIGLTTVDVFPPSTPRFKWVFGQVFGTLDTGAQNSAVLSIFRMDPISYGRVRNDDLRNTRVRKMMNKYIATMYYGVPTTGNPSSITYDNIRGLGDLERMNERIPVAQ
jgi:hypothetical protein